MEKPACRIVPSSSLVDAGMVAVYTGVGDVSGGSDGTVVALTVVEVGTTVGGAAAVWQAISANARERRMVGVFTRVNYSG